MKSQPHVVVIGAGIGGMTTAAHLARQGLRVTVLEKNGRAGGRCDQIEREGHRFDTGPTLLVMPLLYEAEFASLGANLRDLLDLQRVDPTYHLVFDDGSKLALTSDLNALESQLEAIEPGSFQGFLRYLQEGHRHYHLGIERLVNRDFRKATEFFNLRNLPLVTQLKPVLPHYHHMSRFFESPRLKAAFTFQDVYMGLSPFEAPATFSLMPYSELAHGVWYPRGGMVQIAQALMQIAQQAGVEFMFNTAVEQIEVAGKQVRGVVLANGRFLPADAVIANADLPYVYNNLLPPDKMAQKLNRKRFSCSVVSFFWGVDKPYPNLPPHTLFLADDYRENFDSIIDELTIPDNPSVYVHAPARLDPAMAPEGQDTIIGIVPVGHLNADESQDWTAIRDRAREALFQRLAAIGVTDLPNHIKFEMNFSPLSWRQRYNLMKGSTHGLCHNMTQLGYLRPQNRHPRYENLYFVGASTHPGTGVPTAMISGRLAAVRLLEEQVGERRTAVSPIPVPQTA
jgi:phytoene desaturase